MCVVPLLHRRNNSDELPFRCVFFRGLQWQKTLPYKNYYYVPLDNFLPYVPTVLVVVVVVQFLAPVVFYYLPFQPKNCHGFFPFLFHTSFTKHRYLFVPDSYDYQRMSRIILILQCIIGTNQEVLRSFRPFEMMSNY